MPGPRRFSEGDQEHRRQRSRTVYVDFGWLPAAQVAVAGMNETAEERSMESLSHARSGVGSQAGTGEEIRDDDIRRRLRLTRSLDPVVDTSANEEAETDRPREQQNHAVSAVDLQGVSQGSDRRYSIHLDVEQPRWTRAERGSLSWQYTSEEGRNRERQIHAATVARQRAADEGISNDDDHSRSPPSWLVIRILEDGIVTEEGALNVVGGDEEPALECGRRLVIARALERALSHRRVTVLGVDDMWGPGARDPDEEVAELIERLRREASRGMEEEDEESDDEEDDGGDMLDYYDEYGLEDHDDDSEGRWQRAADEALDPNTPSRPLSASKAVIEALPRTRPAYLAREDAEADKECLVCMSAYDDDELLVQLPCGHAYHEECIAEWLEQSSTCPKCRGVVDDLDSGGAEGSEEGEEESEPGGWDSDEEEEWREMSRYHLRVFEEAV